MLGGVTLDSAQSDDDRTTMTRSELLRLRGYDQTTIIGTNGNGHDLSHVAEKRKSGQDEIPPGLEIRHGVTDLRLGRIRAVEVADRTCRGCQKPLDGAPSQQWCSQACRQAARRRTGQTATTTPTATPKTSKPARATNGAPVNLNGSTGDVVSHGRHRMRP